MNSGPDEKRADPVYDDDLDIQMPDSHISFRELRWFACKISRIVTKVDYHNFDSRLMLKSGVIGWVHYWVTPFFLYLRRNVCFQ